MSEEPKVVFKGNHAPETKKQLPVKKIAGVAAAVVILGGGMIASSMADSAAKEKVDDMITKLEKDAGGDLVITYDDIDASIIGSSVTISDIGFKDGDENTVFKVSSIDLNTNGYDLKSEFPESMSLSVEGLEIVGEHALRNLEREFDIDYSDKLIYANIGYDFDKDDDFLSSEITLSTADMSDISFNMAVSNVKDVWEFMESNYANNDGRIDLNYSDERKLQQMLSGVKGNSVSITYTNHGELEKLIQKAADENRVSVAELKAQIPMVIDMYIGNASPDLAEDLKEFFENPERISLSIEPDEPMTVARLSTMGVAAMNDPEGVLDMMNVDVSVN